MIELQQRVVVERYETGSPERHVIYEPIWLDPHRIESMILVGCTKLRMISGDEIEVKETPDQIISLKFGNDMGCPSVRDLPWRKP